MLKTWLAVPLLIYFFQSKKNARAFKYIIGSVIFILILRVTLDKRVGANCCDGSESSSVGSGTCSWHDGVCSWQYQSFVQDPYINLLFGGNTEYSVPTSKIIFH